MIPFLLRRLRLMVLTLAGVIVITFILFNVIGGSTASTILGEKASPRQLEDFETQRGFNKPLLFGSWTRTRALLDSEFEIGPGAWGSVSNALFDNRRHILQLSANTKTPLPLSFDPAGGRYQLQMVTREGAGYLLLNEESLASLSRGVTIVELDAEDLARAQISSGASPLLLSRVQLRRKTDNPLDSQFLFYLKQIVTLDFGTSHFTHQKVSLMLKEGLLPSLCLTVPILIVGLVFSVLFALICAFFRDRLIDRVLVIFSVGLMSVNYLVWIVSGQYVLAYKYNLFPVWGFESWQYLVLPVLIGVVSGFGQDLRLYRTVVLDEMYKEYVRTAEAKGCSRATILFRHVLKNAMIPIITNISLVIPFLFTGSLLLETYFGIPGLGYVSINGIFNRDFDVIRAVVLVGAVLYILANLFADIAYAMIDPRVNLK